MQVETENTVLVNDDVHLKRHVMCQFKKKYMMEEFQRISSLWRHYQDFITQLKSGGWQHIKEQHPHL